MLGGCRAAMLLMPKRRRPSFLVLQGLEAGGMLMVWEDERLDHRQFVTRILSIERAEGVTYMLSLTRAQRRTHCFPLSSTLAYCNALGCCCDLRLNHKQTRGEGMMNRALIGLADGARMRDPP